jgi:hypothetical protein
MSEKLNFIFDSQLLDSFQKCEVNFDYDFQQNLRSTNSIRKMEMGSLLHDFYEIYNLSLRDGLTHADAQNKSTSSIDKLFPARPLEAIDCNIVLEGFIGSSNFWSGQPRTVLTVEKPEVKILYEDEEYRIAYVSKIDVKIDGPNFSNMPEDYKSEHRRSDPLKMTNQFVGYAWTTDAKRMTVRKVGLQKTLKPEEKYRAYPFYYSQSEIDEWVKDTTQWAFKMIEQAKGKTPIRNRTSCDKWGGCKYKCICELSPENREFQLTQFFRAGEPWSPLEKKLEE